MNHVRTTPWCVPSARASATAGRTLRTHPRATLQISRRADGPEIRGRGAQGPASDWKKSPETRDRSHRARRCEARPRRALKAPRETTASPQAKDEITSDPIRFPRPHSVLLARGDHSLQNADTTEVTVQSTAKASTPPTPKASRFPFARRFPRTATGENPAARPTPGNQHSRASIIRRSAYSLLWNHPYSSFAPLNSSPTMLPAVVVLLLLTALVATEPPAPGGRDQ